jgi:hypothetical protein
MSDSFGGQCGMCGKDWFFATREERCKWRDEHNPEHVGFMSFFIKPCEWCGQVDSHENGCRLGLSPDEIVGRPPSCPCGLKERPGSASASMRKVTCLRAQSTTARRTRQPMTQSLAYRWVFRG